MMFGLIFLTFALFQFVIVKGNEGLISFQSSDEFKKFITHQNAKMKANHHSFYKQDLSSFKANKTTSTSHLRGVSTEGSSTTSSHPLFHTSLNIKGKNRHLTMVGGSPSQGKTTGINVALVPIKVTFAGFTADPVVFTPDAAISNIIQSPLFNTAHYPTVGNVQYVDALLRCSFWNKMDKKRKWHVHLHKPTILPEHNITIQNNNGSLLQLSDNNDNHHYYGQIDQTAIFIDLFNYLNNIYTTNTISQDTLIVFVTEHVSTNLAYGFHYYYEVSNNHKLPFIFTTWYDPALTSNGLPPDVSILAHEFAEWAFDPLANNIIPKWKNPKLADGIGQCSDNDLLEVADPVSDYGTYTMVRTNDLVYHMHNSVTLSWFTGKGEVSDACNGWWTFPSEIYNKPAEFCY
mmetsp:Transcript_5071/g.5552  ORF Transcript_5071/g.5552 Transcript_5071/m.5552 type:complete len:403 (-) Transcript_5071:459-1667(-)